MSGIQITKFSSHRYILRRTWLGTGGLLNWIMLNPSTADDVFDDPTIRKCCGFAKRWGFSGIIVTNLFAFRATDPKTLKNLVLSGESQFAIGDENDTAIANAANESDLVVVAWGANAGWCPERVAAVMKMFLVPSCIGVTKDGHPIHPCMAGYTDAPIPFSKSSGQNPPTAAF